VKGERCGDEPFRNVDDARVVGTGAEVICAFGDGRGTESLVRWVGSPFKVAAALALRGVGYDRVALGRQLSELVFASGDVEAGGVPIPVRWTPDWEPDRLKEGSSRRLCQP
jgi:hypothetical protein